MPQRIPVQSRQVRGKSLIYAQLDKKLFWSSHCKVLECFPVFQELITAYRNCRNRAEKWTSETEAYEVLSKPDLTDIDHFAEAPEDSFEPEVDSTGTETFDEKAFANDVYKDDGEQQASGGSFRR